jgi:hypothetical protein
MRWMSDRNDAQRNWFPIEQLLDRTPMKVDVKREYFSPSVLGWLGRSRPIEPRIGRTRPMLYQFGDPDFTDG